MMSKLGLKNFFKASEKTTVADWGNDPTATQINVQIAADYGLSNEHKKAKAAIEDYYNNRNKENNTVMDKLGLAEELTKFAKSGKLDAEPRTILREAKTSDNSLSYYDFAQANGIIWDWNSGRVDVDGTNINLNETNADYSFNTSQGALNWLKEIGTVFSSKSTGN